MSMLLRHQTHVFPSQVSVKGKDVHAGDRWRQRPAMRASVPTLPALC